MQIRHIALVPEMGMDASELARVSAALQKQVTRDLSPIWGIAATVDAFPRLEDLPTGYWPLVLTYRELGCDAGIHVDERGQPFALVELSASWSLTASHICLEMLSDPYGHRTLAGLSPRADQGEVEFLADICDPCVHPQYAYVVNDVLVSDFCVPEFWEISARRERYSFTGAIRAPLEILPSGQLRWYDPRSASWWTRRLDGKSFSDVNLGRVDAKSATAREFLDARTPQHLLATKMTSAAFEERMALRHEQAFQAARFRALGLRASFGNVRCVPQAADLAAGVQARGSAAERPGRPHVFGALLRASLGAAAAERGATAPDVGAPFSSAVASSGFSEGAATADETEEVTTVEPDELIAVDPTPSPNAVPANVEPPPTQVPAAPEAPPPQAQRTIPPPMPALQMAPSLAPVSGMAAPMQTAPSADRTVAIVAIAAAVVLGIAVTHNTTQQPSSSAAVGPRATETALPLPTDPRPSNTTIAPAAAAPPVASVPPVGTSTPGAEPAMTTARRVLPRAKPSVTPRREAEAPERGAEDSLENLIDERR